MTTSQMGTARWCMIMSAWGWTAWSTAERDRSPFPHRILSLKPALIPCPKISRLAGVPHLASGILVKARPSTGQLQPRSPRCRRPRFSQRRKRGCRPHFTSQLLRRRNSIHWLMLCRRPLHLVLCLLCFLAKLDLIGRTNETREPHTHLRASSSRFSSGRKGAERGSTG